MTKPSNAVKNLKFYSNLFDRDPWKFTTEDHITQIRYTKEHDPHNRLSIRIKQAFSWLFSTKKGFRQFFEETRLQALRTRLRMFAYSLKRDTNLPDGVVAGGAIITFWAEDGEYLELVQPSVGSLLADFLIAEPEHPHAKLIIKELNKIQRNKKKEEKDAVL